MRILIALIAVLVGVAATLVYLNLDVRLIGPSAHSLSNGGPTYEISYTDFIAAMFTLATLVLGSVAVVVGLLSMFTYQGLKNEAQRSLNHALKEAKGDALLKLQNEVESARSGLHGSIDDAKAVALQTIHKELEVQIEGIHKKIETTITIEAKEEFNRVIEEAGQNGKFDKAFERVMMATNMGGGELNAELASEEEEER